MGLNTLSEAMGRQTWKGLEIVAPIALAAVRFLLIADFRSIHAGSQAFLPVIPGLLVLLGFAGLLDIPFSLLNLFVVVLVFAKESTTAST